MKRIVAAVIVFGVAGCAQLQNVTVDQIRSDEHKRNEGEIALSIPQIQQAMYDYGAQCRDVGPLRVNPAKPGVATYTGYMPGLTDMSAAMLIDLRQTSNNTTQYKAYTYYKTWAERADDVVSVMSGKKLCNK